MFSSLFLSLVSPPLLVKWWDDAETHTFEYFITLKHNQTNNLYLGKLLLSFKKKKKISLFFFIYLHSGLFEKKEDWFTFQEEQDLNFSSQDLGQSKKKVYQGILCPSKVLLLLLLLPMVGSTGDFQSAPVNNFATVAVYTPLAPINMQVKKKKRERESFGSAGTKSSSSSSFSLSSYSYLETHQSFLSSCLLFPQFFEGVIHGAVDLSNYQFFVGGVATIGHAFCDDCGRHLRKDKWVNDSNCNRGLHQTNQEGWFMTNSRKWCHFPQKTALFPTIHNRAFAMALRIQRACKDNWLLYPLLYFPFFMNGIHI